MSSNEYNQLLKFLYFEGYAESYAEAEELLESMSDDEFDEILEAFKEPDLAKMRRQEDRHRTAAVKQKGGSRGSSKNRAMKMGSIRGALERGEDPRADGYGGKRAERGNPPEDHRAAFSKNPLNNPPRPVKNPGVQREELEMQEAWYSGKGQYRTTVSGRKVRWDEDEATDDAVSAMMQKRREAAAKKAAQGRMKAKGTVPKKDGKDMFESVVEYLFVEGFADTIENAEVMAENISEDWVNEIMEAAKDQSDKQIDKGVKTTYKAGNVLDNQHQGRSKGLNKLPAGEREEKTERMRGRLKARRDDLFQERGNREDAKRAELKKLLGL